MSPTESPAPSIHLADLHARAAELGIENYRLLRRDELSAKISEAEQSAAQVVVAPQEPVVTKTKQKPGGGLFGFLKRRPRADETPLSVEAPAVVETPPPAPPKAEPKPDRQGGARGESGSARSDSTGSQRSRNRNRGSRGGGGAASTESGDAGAATGGDRSARSERGRERQSSSRDRERSGSSRRERSPKAAASTKDSNAKATKDTEAESPEQVETEEVSGVLSLPGQGSGFLRVGGFAAGDDDVQVPAALIRRHGLRAADEVSGQAREPRRGDRRRVLTDVAIVNGTPASDERKPDFPELTPVPPSRAIELSEQADPLVTAVTALAPIAFGQRILVRATPRSGHTELLRGLAAAIGESTEAEVIVLLIDERPEEIPAWKAALPDAEFALAPADMAPNRQVSVAELALERARRRAEEGADAIVICDSLSRLAIAEGGVATVKRLFGTGRETAEPDAGSVTVIASTLSADPTTDDAARAVETTESALIAFDPQLAAAGVQPAIDCAATSAFGLEDYCSPERLEAVRGLRERLAGLEPAAAAEALRESVAG